MALLGAPLLLAQTATSAPHANDPVVPSSAVGAISSSTTVSVMALTGIPSSDEGALPPRQVLFTGLSSGVGRLGSVKFTAVGTGYFTARDAVAASQSAEGALLLRARGRNSWAAISYGRANAMGAIPGSSFGPTAAGTGLDGARADTTVSNRVDVGNVARAEAGLLGRHRGFDMSIGLSVERATRVTTQTLVIETSNDIPTAATSAAARTSVTQVQRGVQRREIATSLASIGFSTGRTKWLVSMAAPVASWITADALSPRPRTAPPVAALTVVQPLTAWLSAVGSASTFSSKVGNTALRDDIALSRNSNFAPVFALGVSIVHIPFLNRRGEVPLGGILGFETHIVNGVDSVIVLGENGTPQAGFRVQIVIDAPAAATVDLIGDATDWTVTGMNRGGDGRWRAVLDVTSGAHRLSVRADGGEWIAPPGLPLGNSDFGNPVGLLVLEKPVIRR
jgi:hypothetical protein